MSSSLRLWLVAAAVAALLGALLMGGGWWPGAGPSGPVALQPGDPQVLALGEKVYATHCATCHGAKLEGQPNWQSRGADGRLPAPPHDETGHTWHHPDEPLFRITKLGVAKAASLQGYDSAMPAYEGVLSDAEIVAALSWIKSKWPAQVRRQHDEINARARQAQQTR
jgi:mono/diheme cytochrome c family protein